VASWYGRELQGHKTASGEPFDMNKLTAAHRTLPFGTEVWVRSRSSKRQVKVRINDRGPYAHGRIIDLSRAAASQLGILGRGEDEVELFVVGK
jgi:rare lipoprotein A